ncbi:hypothetical protein ABL78_0306 [Leptomonas seymouri]|uniref:Uncharacterized protein n=1 Tax=Leptomonas seymouri TaxID=5684 RepID=A0A0N0P903_LEPSE|nr:hypothetical protein ABL78_0306 [Leptomonas seymouri]|eukprot:KPI90546.1 hypothetical protein ABL78_0306 [Leptomonas seymouri]
MSGSPFQHVCQEAVHRLYQRQCTSTLAAADNQAESSTPSDPPYTASSFSKDATLDSLEAFLNSHEENALELLATFTQLTEQDKVKTLAQIEGEAPSTDDNNDPSQKSNIASKMPVAKYGELRLRLQEEVRKHRKTAPAQHVDVYSNVPQIGTGRNNHAGLPPCAEVEDAELETVELEEGTHTGNLVAFFDKGITEVSTSFDCFFGEAAAEAVPAACSVEDHNTGVSVSPPLSSTFNAPGASFELLTLDEILAVDGKEGSAVPFQSTAPEARACPAEEVHANRENSSRAVDEDQGRESDASSFSLSDVSSVVLPGLDGHDDVNAEALRAQHSARKAEREALSSEVAAGLHEVIAEHDDCVQAFALDPLFDYNADIFGEAFRTGKAWRQ